MGAGIAQLAAVKGFEVVIQEIDQDALASGGRRVDALFQKAVENGVLSPAEAAEKIAKIRKTVSWEGFDTVDLVVEAIVEDLEKKQQAFRKIASLTQSRTLLATNTSSLSVGAMQNHVDNARRFAGLHFFNPVHKMPLVEVIRGPLTDDPTLASLVHWASELGKTPVVLTDRPGFVVNRILFPYLNEAGMLVAEGMPVEQVDQIMRRFGMPMGPLELIDQIGIDIASHAAQAMVPLFTGRIEMHPALEMMRQRGWLGQKSGYGFYQYQGKSKKLNRGALATLRQASGGNGHREDWAGREGAEEAKHRMNLLMVNEAAACLAEGMAEQAAVIDLAMVLGTGWAPHRGGPLRFADDFGIREIVKTLDGFASRLGTRFAPHQALRRCAAEGKKYYQDFAPSQLEARII
jgi:3-hydroxyacyl-CoA dehydrogenase/enoyl-CoA hydratase/3-hydroxybutyryl-CoA epimerase